MRAYIDHILAILPFEPDSIAKLDGPPTTYVGHRLASDPEILNASREQGSLETSRFATESRTVLLLPGSRRGEIRRSMPLLKEVVQQWTARGANYRLVLPTLPRLEPEVRKLAQDWAIKPEIVTGQSEKMRLFASADAALAASGTVTLELALCSVPTVAFYKTDPLIQFVVYRLFSAWSASLPNLIADEPVIPESYNEQATPGILARQIERLLINGPARQAQVQGFARLRTSMETPAKPSQIAARIVLDYAHKHQARP